LAIADFRLFHHVDPTPDMRVAGVGSHVVPHHDNAHTDENSSPGLLHRDRGCFTTMLSKRGYMQVAVTVDQV